MLFIFIFLIAVAMFNTPDFYVCGITAVEHNLVLLTFDKHMIQEVKLPLMPYRLRTNSQNCPSR